MEFDPDIIRERIQAMLDRTGWSDYKLAEISGVPHPTIFRFMKGRHKTLDLYTLVRIAHAFDMRSAQFTGEEPMDDDVIQKALADPKIRAAALQMLHMSEETKAQYVRIGGTFIESREANGQ